jgi:hypothetical protein
MLNKISQTEEDKYHMFSLTCGIQTKKKRHECKTRAALGGTSRRREDKRTR